MRREVLWTFCLLLAVTSATWAVPIDGIVLVGAIGAGGPCSYFMDGNTDATIAAPMQFPFADMCPTMERAAYSLRDGIPVTACDIWTADLDGTNAVNVTTALGGVNCWPDWSPDASEIAFQRAVPHDGIPPCLIGFEVWVMDADGSNAHRTSPLGLWVAGPSWSVDGFRISCHDTDGPNAHLVDKDGTDWSTPTALGGQAQWSPDGTSIASVTYDYGEIGGEIGVWRQLILTDTAGANPVVLREQFIADSTLFDYLAENGGIPTDPVELEYALRGLRVAIGPCSPQWSPRGDQILFREIVGFDPHGIAHQFQTELWLYDFGTDSFLQITDNEDAEMEVSWGGYNTEPDQLTVTVGNVTISFDQVLGPGVTVVLRDDDPPDVDAGLEFDGFYYEIHTTAEVTGPITICMDYSDAAAPTPEAEEALAIIHWDGAQWVDATVAKDMEANTICAQVDSLSPLALHGARDAMFSDVPAWGLGTDGLSPFWAYYAIQSCADGGVVAGYPGGSYQPAGAVDRGQMAVYIARALAGNEGSVPLFSGESTFSDVPGNFWALKHIEYAVAEDVVGGYSDGTYRPDWLVDRGQMAVYMARARGWIGIADDMTTAPEVFPDVSAGFWAGTAVQACVEHGVVQGYDDGNYYPANIVTRDQMAVYVARAFGL